MKIQTFQDDYKAQIALDILENEDINAIVINKQDSSYLMFGGIELYVKHEDVINALKLIGSEP